ALFSNDLQGAMIGVDGSEIFEAYTNDSSNVAFYLVGYLTDNFVSITNGVDYSTGTTNSYVDVDVSSDVASGYDAALFHMWPSDSNFHLHALRKNGETDDIYANLG